MLTSSVTATTGMFTVLSDTSVTAGNMATLFACFMCTSWHFEIKLTVWNYRDEANTITVG